MNRVALQELAGSYLAHELVVFDDDLAPLQDQGRVAFDGDVFVGTIVHVHVQVLLGQLVLLVGVPEHQVGIAADGDSTLLGVKSKEAGWSCGTDLDETVKGKPPLAHSLAVDKRHPGFDSWRTVGDLREIITPALLLFGKGPRAVVCGNGL